MWLVKHILNHQPNQPWWLIILQSFAKITPSNDTKTPGCSPPKRFPQSAQSNSGFLPRMATPIQQQNALNDVNLVVWIPFWITPVISTPRIRGIQTSWSIPMYHMCMLIYTRPGKHTKWKITISNGKIHYKWQFSIAMLNYQRASSCPILYVIWWCTCLCSPDPRYLP